MINLEKIDENLKETRIYQEFIANIHDFLINAHKFYELVQNLHKKLTFQQEISVETLINQAKFAGKPDLASSPPKRENLSLSPLKSNEKNRENHENHENLKNHENREKRAKTPEITKKSTINWKIEDKSEICEKNEGKKMEIEIEAKEKGSAIREIIEKSFEKKIQKGHCFVYEENAKEMDKSWKELLDLRSEITKLLWEEERRVKIGFF